MNYVPGSSQVWKRSLRLTFTYEGTSLNLESQQSVQMRSYPSHSLEGYEGLAGYWYILLDANDRVIYRRIISNPIQLYHEVFPKDRKQPITRRQIDNPSGRLFLITPDIPEAVEIVFYGSPLDRENPYQPAEVFARFELIQDQGMEERQHEQL